MRNIIIDCDPGYDDALAILLALAHKDKLNILGITTVEGNQSLEKVTKNALNVLEYMKEDIKVYKGEKYPIIRELGNVSGSYEKNTMVAPDFPQGVREPENIHAVEFMAKSLEEISEKITLVPIAPLTNIALLIKNYPHLLHKIEEITLMGGGINGGNYTSASEFNFYIDPEAAKIVFNSGIKITMCGLDVTNKAYITKEEFNTIRSAGKVTNIITELMDFYSEYGNKFGYNTGIHDACAIAYLIDKTIFKSSKYHIDIVVDSELCRGMTLADRRGKERNKSNNINVVLELDRIKFKELLISSYRRLNKLLEV